MSGSIQARLNEVLANLAALSDPLEQAKEALKVVTWCQQSLSTAGQIRRQAFVRAAETMTDVQIAAATGVTPAVVRRMITEGRQQLHQSDPS